MIQIFDEKKLEDALEQGKIRDKFSCSDLSFLLFQYDEGELINYTGNPCKYLQFLIQGELMIYAQQKNGSRHYIHQVSAPAVIGDMEFLYQQESGLLIEAKKTVICVALQTELYRTVLEEDATFLRFLLRSVSEKLYCYTHNDTAFLTIRDKAEYYIVHRAPEQTITDIGKTAVQLQCSRRQLQRALQQLQQEGIIEKQGKGQYFLRKNVPFFKNGT